MPVPIEYRTWTSFQILSPGPKSFLGGDGTLVSPKTGETQTAFDHPADTLTFCRVSPGCPVNKGLPKVRISGGDMAQSLLLCSNNFDNLEIPEAGTTSEYQGVSFPMK